MAQLMQGFSKLNRTQRLQRLIELDFLDHSAIELLNRCDLEYLTLADQCIENAIGMMPIPLGVAMYFKIDGKDHAIPMAVEETSIIAAASATAKWIRQSGYITTQTLGTHIIGQIQFPKVQNLNQLKMTLQQHESYLIQEANTQVVPNLVRRGGGVSNLHLRTLIRPDGETMAVIHVHLNPCDAMGANYVTQVCEFLKPKLMTLTGEDISLCILSNLCDTQLFRAEITLQNIEPDLGHAIEEAALFAKIDPYRAATHNKGIMNGVDAMLLATGNDWRAVAAGMHAYAAKDGQYTALSDWQFSGNQLIGTMTAPINVGIVGGVTRIHPMAQLALKILNVQHAFELARIAAAVGLVQNLGALRSLVSTGITAGHMRLHIKNLILTLDANEHERNFLKQKLESHLSVHNRISLSDAKHYLTLYRKQKTEIVL